MIKVALVRGKYLNEFEGQNFKFLNSRSVNLTGISSVFPLSVKSSFKTKKFLSPLDYLDNRIGKFIANRTIGDLHLLVGLEKEVVNFDIFHTADPHYYFSYQLAKLRHEGKINLLLSTSWETIPFNNESTHAKKVIKRFTMKNIDYFICPTQKAKESLVKEGINTKRIILLPIGVDLNRFKKSKRIKQEKVILFVGRLVSEKGIGDLYSVFVDVFARNKEIKLKIIGDGPMKASLNTQIKRDGMRSQISMTVKSYDRMHLEYKKADVVVIPSKTTKTWEEQYGMVAVEAMASGAPILAYSSGALPEVISEAGILVEEGDKRGLSRALTKILKDDQLRSRLGTIARRRAEAHFDSKKISEKYQLMYETLGRNTFQK